jgi:hypothetical protein
MHVLPAQAMQIEEYYLPLMLLSHEQTASSRVKVSPLSNISWLWTVSIILDVNSVALNEQMQRVKVSEQSKLNLL